MHFKIGNSRTLLSLSILLLFFSSCLDVFFDKTEKIAGDIYFVNLNGSGRPFIGRKFGNSNFSILFEENIIDVTGNKSSLLIRQDKSYRDTAYYMIYPEEQEDIVDTLTKEVYYEVLGSIERNVNFVPDQNR